MCSYSRSFLSNTERPLITGTFFLFEWCPEKGSRCYVLERKKEPCKSTTKKVLNSHTLGFHPQTQKLELHTK